MQETVQYMIAILEQRDDASFPVVIKLKTLMPDVFLVKINRGKCQVQLELI
jgi:hypothetical protein